MELLLIAIVALLASLLTFFSGFGLGTILTPVFILFFPLDVAIALTAVVHLLNNLFKVALIGKYVVWDIALKFGLPAIVGAFIGANLLLRINDVPDWTSYILFEREYFISPVKFTIAILMILFALFDIIPTLRNMKFERNKLYFGGLVSGFFGGLSGHQGALRSAFLLRYGLSKQGFIATGIVIASAIDVARISVYSSILENIRDTSYLIPLITAVLSAFIGAYFGRKLLKKVTLHSLHLMVAIGIIILAILLGAGIIK